MYLFNLNQMLLLNFSFSIILPQEIYLLIFAIYNTVLR